MAEQTVATDEQVDEIFPDLNSESDASDSVNKVEKVESPEVAEVEEPVATDSETSIESPEVESDASEDPKDDTDDKTQDDSPPETMQIKKKWQTMEKDDLLSELADTEEKRRDSQSKLDQSNSKVQAISSIEDSTNMSIEHLTPLIKNFADPKFVEYVQSYLDGKPQNIQYQSDRKLPKDFMPEGEEYDTTEANDPTTTSGQAKEKYDDLRHSERVQRDQTVQTQKQTKIKEQEAENYVLNQNITKTEWHELANKYKDPIELTKLILSTRNGKKEKVSVNLANDMIQVVRTNKSRVTTANVSGTAPAPKGKKTPEEQVFGDE